MNSAKREVEELLKQIPDNASYEDIQYRIYVRQKIAQERQTRKRAAS